MQIIDSEHLREILETEIRRQTAKAFDLLIVDDIARWNAEREGSVKGNPPAAAIVDSQSGIWGILLRLSIDHDWVDSIISRIEVLGYIKVREVLSSPEIFLRHLVLHELAHLENGWSQDQEEQCDEWAFKKLDLQTI